MAIKPSISLSIPNPDKQGRYFSLKLKQVLLAESSEYSSVRRLVAISDIEGNFQQFCKLLMKIKVIDKYFNWIFEEGHLVIVGDCFDRGDLVIECLWLIYMLEEKAIRHGGKVHFILGNHEIMNMNGDWHYVHPKYAQNTKSSKPHAALYDANNEIWRWLRTKNVIEKIGDILFVHGGISPAMLSLSLTIPEINEICRPWYHQSNRIFTDPLLQVVFNSDDSPFWYRGYYTFEGNLPDQTIAATLMHFNVKTIVTGHTVVGNITSYFANSVINIDTDHATGNSEALMVNNGKFYSVSLDGTKKRIK